MWGVCLFYLPSEFGFVRNNHAMFVCFTLLATASSFELIRHLLLNLTQGKKSQLYWFSLTLVKWGSRQHPSKDRAGNIPLLKQLPHVLAGQSEHTELWTSCMTYLLLFPQVGRRYTRACGRQREYWLGQNLKEGQPWRPGEIKRIIVEMAAQVSCMVH